MEGTGYFWKGLADSFSGWRDKRFADDKAQREREMKREELMLGAGLRQSEGDLDRRNTMRIANLNYGSSSLPNYASPQNSWLDSATAKVTAAQKLLEGLPGMPPSEDDKRQAAAYMAEARDDRAMGLAFAEKMGVKPPKQLSFVEQLEQARQKRLGNQVK